MNSAIATLSDKLRQSAQDNNSQQEANNIISELFHGEKTLNLDYSLTNLFEALMKEGGLEVANRILSNLDKIKITYSDQYQAQNLAEHIIDVVPTSDAATKLVDWSFDLILKSFINEQIDVSDNWSFYEKTINKLITDPKYTTYDLNKVILQLAMKSPSHLGKILQTIKTTKQKISLHHLVTYLVENKVSLDQLEDNLEVIGKLDPANDSIIHAIVQGYPNNCVTNVFKYLKESNTDFYRIDSVIKDLSQSLKENEIEEFYGHLETIYRGKLVSKSILNALLANTNIPTKKLINSKLSEQVYKSFLNEIYWIEKDYIPQSSHYKINDLLSLLAMDSSYLNLREDALQRELVKTVGSTQASKENDKLKIHLLTHLPMNDKYFDNGFVSEWFRDCNPYEASKLLNSLEKNQSYPFRDFKLLIYIYRNLESQDAKNFVAKRLKPLFTKEKYEFNNACHDLVMENDNNFCLYFIQKSKKLLKGAEKYDAIHKTKRLAFSKLTLVQRFKVMLSF
jgi:hypothetical protein